MLDWLLDLLIQLLSWIGCHFYEPEVVHSWIVHNGAYAYAFYLDVLNYKFCGNITIPMVGKLALLLVFLSAIRGGVPRYRYDFLTKMGWVKFLGYLLGVFLITFILCMVW